MTPSILGHGQAPILRSGRPWLCAAPIALCLTDLVLNRGAPPDLGALARALLTALWISLFSLLLVFLPLRPTKVLALAITLGHAIHAIALSGPGPLIRVGPIIVLLSALLIVATWEQAGADRQGRELARTERRARWPSYLFNPWVVVLGLGSWGMLYLATAREAEALSAAFLNGSTEEAASALWRLSAARPGVKRKVLERFFDSQESAARFRLERGRILHAAMGLDPANRSLLRDIVRSRCGASSLRVEDYRNACVALIEALPPREIPAEYLTRALLASSDPTAIRWIAGVLSLTGTTSLPAQKRVADLMAVAPPSGSGSAMLSRPAGCFLDDPATLRPIWAKLPPAAAGELRARNLKRLLNAAEPSTVFCLGAALAAWDELPHADAAAAWHRLFLFTRFRTPPDWVRGDRFKGISAGAQRSLAALAARLSPEGAAEAWGRIVGRAERRASRSQRILGASLPVLARKLPLSARAAAGATLLPLIREGNPDLLPDLFQAAAALGPGLPEAVRRKAVRRFPEAIRGAPAPPCGAVTAIAGREELPALLELVKWPTCPPAERDDLVRKISQLTGTPFGREDRNGTFHFDRWKLSDWAQRHGFHPEVPPWHEAPSVEERLENPLFAVFRSETPPLSEPEVDPQHAVVAKAMRLRVLQDLQRGRPRGLAVASRALPGLVWLDHLALEHQRLTIAGSAFHPDAVANFIENLDRTPTISEPILLDLFAAGDGTYRFFLQVETWGWIEWDLERMPLTVLPQPTPRGDIPGLQKEICELVARSDLPVDLCAARTSIPVREEDDTPALEIRIAPVSYADTVRLLARLSRLPRLVVVETLSITPDARDSRRLAVDLLIETPTAPPGTDAHTAPEPQAGPEDEEELQLPPHDPFSDLRHIRTRGGRPPGIAGLLIDELRLLGFRRSGKGYVARVRDSMGDIYLLRPGDLLYDGDVVSVSRRELVFKQIVQDPTALKPFREVVRRPPPRLDPPSPGGPAT